MKIYGQINNNNIKININGSLTVENVRDFEKTLNDYCVADKHIILDLLDVNYIDSSSLGIIILYLTRLEKNNLHIILINVKNEIKEMFTITGVNKLLKIFDTEKDAFEFLKTG